MRVASPVKLRLDAMLYTEGANAKLRRAVHEPHGVRHADDGFEGVTLLASGRGAVDRLIRSEDTEVEHALNHVSRDAHSVVLDAQPD